MSKASTDERSRSEWVAIAYLAFLGMLMATGIDIALPAFGEIDADLGADGRESLIVTLYLLGAAFGQLVVGPVSDMVGRRPVVLVGLVLYLVGAAACALAPSYGFLLGARFVWGIGAAAPTGMRTAITRDLYSGDAMARITTIIMAVFLLGPVFTPLIGQGLLSVAPWPVVFWFAVVLGVVSVGLAWIFGETLPPESRRPAELAQFALASRRIRQNKATFGYLVANVAWSAAFFIFLGSAQPVFDRVYGRGDSFAVFFAALGLATIPLLLLNNQLIARIGALRTSRITGLVSVTACWVGAAVVITLGEPGFWPWYLWLVVAASSITLTSPSIYALALEPMGDFAGTVSALLFFTGFALGSLLAAIVDAQIGNRVAPFVIGFTIYTTIGLTAQVWAGRQQVSTAGAGSGMG